MACFHLFLDLAGVPLCHKKTYKITDQSKRLLLRRFLGKHDRLHAIEAVKCSGGVKMHATFCTMPSKKTQKKHTHIQTCAEVKMVGKKICKVRRRSGGEKCFFLLKSLDYEMFTPAQQPVVCRAQTPSQTGKGKKVHTHTHTHARTHEEKTGRRRKKSEARCGD